MPVPPFARKIDELLRPCNGEERRSGRGFFGWKLHRLPPPDFMRVHIPMVQTEKRFYERVFTSISYSFTRLFSTRRRGPSQFNEWNLNLWLVQVQRHVSHPTASTLGAFLPFDFFLRVGREERASKGEEGCSGRNGERERWRRMFHGELKLSTRSDGDICDRSGFHRVISTLHVVPTFREHSNRFVSSNLSWK